MMLPAALSLLTTTFSHPVDRAKALGAWGALGGLGVSRGRAAGRDSVRLLGLAVGVLRQPAGVPCVLFAIFRLLPADPPRHRGRLDVVGAFLLTAAMLLLVFTIIDAPQEGWGSDRTVGGLIGSAVLLLVFVVFEARQRHPLFPFSIFAIKGSAKRTSRWWSPWPVSTRCSSS